MALGGFYRSPWGAGRGPAGLLSCCWAQALLQTQADLITLQASQSFQPFLSSSAEQVRAPCPACGGTGQGPQPRTQLSLPRLPKRPRFPENLVLQTQGRVPTCIYTYACLAGTQGAALQGLVDLQMTRGAHNTLVCERWGHGKPLP